MSWCCSCRSNVKCSNFKEISFLFSLLFLPKREQGHTCKISIEIIQTPRSWHGVEQLRLYSTNFHHMQDSSTFFKRHPKCGKKHLMVENCYYLMEMIEQCSRCWLPTGSETPDQKSENVKSCVTPMPTNNPIFVIIRFIKTPLHYEKLRTWVTPLRSHINFIVGPTGPNK